MKETIVQTQCWRYNLTDWAMGSAILARRRKDTQESWRRGRKGCRRWRTLGGRTVDRGATRGWDPSSGWQTESASRGSPVDTARSVVDHRSGSCAGTVATTYVSHYNMYFLRKITVYNFEQKALMSIKKLEF